MSAHEAADAVLRSHDGVISRRQALVAGLSARQIEVLVLKRIWVRILTGVYRGGQHEISEVGWARSVVLWAGHNAVLGGTAAAWWWGLCPGYDNVVEVVIPHRRTLSVPAQHRDRIQVSRQFIDTADRTEHRGLQVFTPALATLMGMIRLRTGGSQMLDRVLQRHLGLAELERTAGRMSGTHGIKQIRRLLAIAADGAAAESERMMVRMFKDAGITGWQINRALAVRGRHRIPDFLFGAQRVIVEIDGWAFHHDVERFQEDRTRQNELILAGWIVLRFTWHQLENEPHRVIREIREALSLRENVSVV